MIHNNIVPDIVLTTDGGFWAGEHLKSLLRCKDNIFLAASSEAYIPKKILSKTNIIPLCYSDGLSKELFDYTKIKFNHAERNGTVSGTALLFAKSISDGKIFFCGLDLCPSKNFVHTQPNELELNSMQNDSRISTIYTRNTPKGFANESLDIYYEWFCSNNFGNDVYRVIKNPVRKIASMKEIDENEMDKLLGKIASDGKNYPANHKKEFLTKSFEKIEIPNSKKTYELVENKINSEEWKKQLFPLDYVSLSHAENNNEESKIQEKAQELNLKIRKIFNE